jgi:BASS family bile acid:Na+ symporter
MDAAQLIRLDITVSILLLVFALGLGATVADVTYLLRRPLKLLRALAAMFLVVPLAAAALAYFFRFAFPVEVALIAMAVSPVPPILPGKQLKLGGRAGYVYGLLVAMSLAAIVLVPPILEVLGWIFPRDAHIDSGEVGKILGLSVLVPVAAGLAVGHLAPSLANRLEPLASRVGTLLLAVGLIPVLVMSTPPIWTLIGNGTLVAILAVVGVGLAAGHLLGGPGAADRRALAIASCMRHPGVAMAIGRLNFPDEPLVPGGILLFLMVAAIATTVYGKWTQRVARAA